MSPHGFIGRAPSWEQGASWKQARERQARTLKLLVEAEEELGSVLLGPNVDGLVVPSKVHVEQKTRVTHGNIYSKWGMAAGEMASYTFWVPGRV